MDKQTYEKKVTDRIKVTLQLTVDAEGTRDVLSGLIKEINGLISERARHERSQWRDVHVNGLMINKLDVAALPLVTWTEPPPEEE